MTTLILFESASGYALFDRLEAQEVASQSDEIQASIVDFRKFSKIVQLKAFFPFTSAENALENVNQISEGLLPDLLKDFLAQSLPKVKPGKKSSSVVLYVSEEKLGSAIQDEFHIKCERTTLSMDLARGIRAHFTNFIKELRDGDLEKAQLGLGHSYSRAKVKFNIHKVDNMIIQSIALVDQMDKDVNTFSMRVREWYAWHFPELSKIVTNNYDFARLVKVIKDKSSMGEDKTEDITAIVGEEKAQEIADALRSSMGTDIAEFDMVSIENFAERVISLSEYREKLHVYLDKKMHDCAPNLSSLIGEMVGARLISKAGSLTNLAKYPASTVQILGAEKALFRALKTRGKTPKYGLIYHSTFIGQASQANKGRISRFLANKTSLASRIDSFSEEPTTIFGEKFKEQVEERLKFLETGKAPRKNIDVMREAVKAVLKAKAQQELVTAASDPKRKRKIADVESSSKNGKKSKKQSVKEVEDNEEESEEEEQPKKKKAKETEEEPKSKKAKKEKVVEEEEPKSKSKKEKVVPEAVPTVTETKSKKSKKEKIVPEAEPAVVEGKESKTKKSKKEKVVPEAEPVVKKSKKEKVPEEPKSKKSKEKVVEEKEEEEEEEVVEELKTKKSKKEKVVPEEESKAKKSKKEKVVPEEEPKAKKSKKQQQSKEEDGDVDMEEASPKKNKKKKKKSK